MYNDNSGDVCLTLLKNFKNFHDQTGDLRPTHGSSTDRTLISVSLHPTSHTIRDTFIMKESRRRYDCTSIFIMETIIDTDIFDSFLGFLLMNFWQNINICVVYIIFKERFGLSLSQSPCILCNCIISSALLSLNSALWD